MPERYELFVYLSAEAFRKLTPQQKQEYVQALSEYLQAVRIRERTADRSHSVEH